MDLPQWDPYDELIACIKFIHHADKHINNLLHNHRQLQQMVNEQSLLIDELLERVYLLEEKSDATSTKK